MTYSAILNPCQMNPMRMTSPSILQQVLRSTNLKLKQPLLEDVFQRQQNPSSVTSNGAEKTNVYSLDALIDENENIKNSANDIRTRRLSAQFLNQVSEDGINIADFLADKKLSSRQSLQLLYNLSSNPETAVTMVEGLTAEPKKSKEIYQKLLSSVVSDEKDTQLFKSWYYDEESGYKSAYKTFYEQKFNEAQKLEDIVKISPNPAPWALRSKAESLGTEFTIGELPQDIFPDLNSYRGFLDFLKGVKPGEEIDIGDGASVKLITGSMSAKRIFKIQSEQLGDYILKVDPCRPDINGNSYWHKNMRYNQDLRADMPYLNATIDFYLKLNGYENNVADVQFYDHSTGSILYKATKGEEANDVFDPRTLNNLYLLRQNPTVKSFQDCGIYLNDIHNGNFIKDENGTLVLIDSGHAKFQDPLKPLVEKQIELSNLCGKSISV